jgi:S1-C subfamily serine protease
MGVVKKAVFRLAPWLPVLAFLVSALPSCGTALRAAAGPGTPAAIAQAWGDTVVQVRVVTKYRVVMQGREFRKGENEVEALGTVIDPSGLTVLSNTNIDPTKAYADMIKKAKSGGEDAGSIDIEGSFADVRMLLPDGTELPAQVVLRDKDLDLAFVRPTEKPAKPLAAVDLSKDGKPAMFDELMLLGRMGAIGGRVASASIFRVEAVVRKPRSYYLVDQNAVTGRLGSPAFTMDGKVAGILLLRAMEAQDGGSGPLEMVFGGIGRLGLYPVILPAEEVAAVAKQAR